MNDDESFMRKALAQARQALAQDEVPIGAVVVASGRVVGRGHNQVISNSDPTAHAEIVAIRDAARYQGTYRLTDTTIYVTIEPCLMCAGSLVHSRVSKIVYGAREPKAGVINSNARVLDAPFLNHRVEVVGGVMAAECRALVQEFFAKRREPDE